MEDCGARTMTDPIRDMKFYSETKMRPLREAFEREVLAWPNVARKGMMGCLVYFRGRRFFAFLVNGGLVITKLSGADLDAFAKRPGAKPFEMSGRITKMIQVPLNMPADLRPLIPFLRTAYEASA